MTVQSISDSPCITSCKKPGVLDKPNIPKKSLANIVYLANAIAKFMQESARVEEYKTAISKKMTTWLIVCNKTSNKCKNDVIFKIVQLEMQSQREATTL